MNPVTVVVPCGVLAAHGSAPSRTLTEEDALLGPRVRLFAL